MFEIYDVTGFSLMCLYEPEEETATLGEAFRYIGESLASGDGGEKYEICRKGEFKEGRNIQIDAQHSFLEEND